MVDTQTFRTFILILNEKKRRNRWKNIFAMLFDYRIPTFDVNYLLLLFSSFPYSEFMCGCILVVVGRQSNKLKRYFCVHCFYYYITRAMVLPFAVCRCLCRVSRNVINYVFINFRMCDDDDGGGDCSGNDDAVLCTLFAPRAESTIFYCDAMRCDVKY